MKVKILRSLYGHRALGMTGSEYKMLKSIQGYFGKINKQAEDAKLAEEEYIARIKRGQLSPVHSNLLLDTSEYCYMEGDATYHRNFKSGVKTTTGRLTITSVRVIFSSSDNASNWDIGLSKILAVQPKKWHGSFELKTSGTKGSGHFETRTRHASLIVESAAKLYKRLLEMPIEGELQTRRIPQTVRVAVWQRDGGRCTQCGASDYLEFDHIIPFSKGGANTENNLQLLCRRCNLGKGARI
jgi:hypothetical protein